MRDVFLILARCGSHIAPIRTHCSYLRLQKPSNETRLLPLKTSSAHPGTHLERPDTEGPQGTSHLQRAWSVLPRRTLVLASLKNVLACPEPDSYRAMVFWPRARAT